MSPWTVASRIFPLVLLPSASGSIGARISTASRKISPAMMSPEMK